MKTMRILKDILAYSCTCTIILVSIVLSELISWVEGKDHNDDASRMPRRPRGCAHQRIFYNECLLNLEDPQCRPPASRLMRHCRLCILKSTCIWNFDHIVHSQR